MKKFIVRDEDNQEIVVEELGDDTAETSHDETSESMTLSVNEIEALKKLALVADKLIALTTAKDAESEVLADEDADKDEDEEDTEVIDTDEEEDEKLLRNDSKVAVGAIEKNVKANDSIADAAELDIASAWAKRYGGNK